MVTLTWHACKYKVHKLHQRYILKQSPGKVKKREVSWTLTKKIDTFAGTGEIKGREVVLDPQVSPEEIKSREVELCSKRSKVEPSLFLLPPCPPPPFPPPPPHHTHSIISHLAKVDIKQNVYLLTSSKDCIYAHAR